MFELLRRLNIYVYVLISKVSRNIQQSKRAFKSWKKADKDNMEVNVNFNSHKKFMKQTNYFSIKPNLLFYCYIRFFIVGLKYLVAARHQSI